MKRNNPLEPLDREERELIDSIDRDEWTEAADARKLAKRAQLYAEATIKKDRRMNIRISERDLKNLKRKALEDGIPYQTMVSMVLHKYVSGQYMERALMENPRGQKRGRKKRILSGAALG